MGSYQKQNVGKNHLTSCRTSTKMRCIFVGLSTACFACGQGVNGTDLNVFTRAIKLTESGQYSRSDKVESALIKKEKFNFNKIKKAFNSSSKKKEGSILSSAWEWITLPFDLLRVLFDLLWPQLSLVLILIGISTCGYIGYVFIDEINEKGIKYTVVDPVSEAVKDVTKRVWCGEDSEC